MCSVWIHHQVERLAELDEPIYEALRALIVNVVITRAVDDQQLSTKSFGKVDSRSQAVARNIFLRQAHIAFLIDGVVKLLIRNGRNRNADLIKSGKAEHCVQRICATA